MPADDARSYPDWPRSEALDAEFHALRQQLVYATAQLTAGIASIAAIDQRLTGLQLAYNAAADYATARLVGPLSRRETEVLRLVARGLSNQAVAAELGISPGTVKNHLTSIMAKLRVRRRMDAARRAQVLGMI